jgi:L-ascorbate peroxidase
MLQGTLDVNNSTKGVGIVGGCSWTINWLQFDNSYFRRPFELLGRNGEAATADPELLWLPTDQALLDAPEFHEHFVRFAQDQAAFFEEYAAAHRKMSELGAKFERSAWIPL